MSNPSITRAYPLVWLITGCTSGFGKLFVPAIIARGDKVIATARNASSLEEFADRDEVRFLQLDVTASQDDLNATAAAAVKLFGRIDALVNNAGYVLSGVWEEVSNEQVLEQFQTNLFGHLNVTRAFLPHMRFRGTGTIVFMSSIAGWMGVAGGGPYSASKFALEGAVESLEKEVLPLGIKVHLIVLGQFRTNILVDGRRKVSRPVPPIDDYNGVLDALMLRHQQSNGNQPGDPSQAVERILDVVRREGSMAEKGEIPLRVILGSDAGRVVRNQCLETLRQLDQYQDLVCSTDIPSAGEIQEYR